MNKTLTHEWTYIQFSFNGWVECTCGFRPDSQEEMDRHIPIGDINKGEK